jgi:Tol biopolymer transport system component
MNKFVKLSFIVIIVSFVGCKNNILDASADEAYRFCYVKSFNGHWELFTNEINGTALQNVSNYTDDDDYPQWSPDGRYILYNRFVSAYGPLVIVYDSKAKSELCLTSDGGLADAQPQWTPSGQVCIAYQRPIGSKKSFYLMNPDGSNKRKIFGYPADANLVTLYFYADSYRFLYKIEDKIYKTNIDGSINDLVLDESSSSFYTTIRDFNQYTGEFLINTNGIPGSTSAIATLNVDTKQLNAIILADSGYSYMDQRYSNDHTKIVFIEVSDNYKDEYLSVLENGIKRRLVHISVTTPAEHFSWVPMQFSPDDKYIAFSKQVWRTGGMLAFTEYLYIVEVATGELHFIENGRNPSWNPRP